MKNLILVSLTILSLGVNADLKRAIEFDQAGEYEKAAKELYTLNELDKI